MIIPLLTNSQIDRHLMPIQFSCSCSKVLKVREEHAGKVAKCPNCGQQVKIPLQSSAPVSNPQPPLKAAQQEHRGEPFPNQSTPQDDNPFSSPNQPYKHPKPVLQQSGPQPVTFDQVFSVAWKAWQDHLGLLFATSAVVFVLTMGIGFVVGFWLEILRHQDETMYVIGNLVYQVLGNLLSIFLGIGLVKINLEILRTGQSSFGTLFSGGGRLLPVIGFSIVFGLAVALGFVLLIIPGIILLLFYWGTYYEIVDGQPGSVFGSFGEAYKYCSINVGTTLIIYFASMGIMLLGMLALCVGVLFATPLVSMMYATAYMMMSGQMRPGLRR